MVDAGKKIDQAFDRHIKEWTREGVVPIQGSTNVIVEFWTFYDRRVKISIGLLPAESEAAEWLTDFLHHDTKAKRVEGIGDAAVSWGYFDRSITFQRGPFGVSVSSEVDLNLFSQGRKENEAMSLTEAAATSKLIACFINLALEGKLTGDRQRSREPIFVRACEQELVFKRLINKDFLNRY